jgi:PqqD family protein of HPr-rel-A system
MAGPSYIADTQNSTIVELEGLSLLFHPRSGTTHILAPPSPEIVAALAQGPADAAALLERLRTEFDMDEAAGEDALAARLAELEAAGLVRRI